jgi:hypothetical protein
MSFIKYNKIFSETLKAKAKQYLLVCHNGFEKADFALMIPLQ